MLQLLRPMQTMLHMLQDPYSPDIQSRAALNPRHMHHLVEIEGRIEGRFAEGDVSEGQETLQASIVYAEGVAPPQHEAEHFSAVLVSDGNSSPGRPICTIESHRALMKRAEAAEQRCRTLEALIQSDKDGANSRTDSLRQALERAQAAEVCNDLLLIAPEQILSWKLSWPVKMSPLYLGRHVCNMHASLWKACAKFLIWSAVLKWREGPARDALISSPCSACRIGAMKWQQCWQQPPRALNSFSWRMQPYKIGSPPWKKTCKPHEVFLLDILKPHNHKPQTCGRSPVATYMVPVTPTLVQ